MFRLLLASILVLMSSIAKAQIEEEECHGDQYSGDIYDSAIWAGDFRILYIPGGEGDEGWGDGYVLKSIGASIANSRAIT